ncbi:putative cell wall biogenesis protein Mhp1 [Aspergillus undulatus]|uniref:putative cell wall biogenesis protein Mhp1 n=1 Tax=Aspergillus undulatus TaxID=1810928 RepID=UPI003CCD5705
MEGVETVDVSWLHHSHKDNNLSRCRSVSSLNCDKPNQDVESPTIHRSNSDKISVPDKNLPTPQNASAPPAPSKLDARSADSRSVTETKTGDATASNETPPASEQFPKSTPKPIGRRGSWISTLSSKFSSGSTPPSQSNVKPQAASKASPPASKLDMHNPFGAAYSPKDKEEERKDENSPFTSTSPRGPSFLQSAFRKLSSSGSGGAKAAPCNGSICERRTLNIDKDRDRCKVPDLNPVKLRRVAFCVDVEIAGIAPREPDEESPPSGAPRRHVIEVNGHKPKRTNSKSKSKDEAEPLKRQQSTPVEKEVSNQENGAPNSTPSAPAPNESKTNGEVKEPSRKQEKKKRSEEERQQRREKKRRLAEANGSIPLQLTADDHVDDPKSTGNTRPGVQNHPTTDPIRIYRRCCQLRETPVLKRIVDEISSPSSTLAESPGTVAVLDLTNFPMTSEDITTFSDWLAVVPVRKLILEKCALTDDAVRAILSGLLSTKTVEQMRRRRGKPKRANIQAEKIERFSVVERLSLKDNPKIGPEGWRHISLFIHLSKSLKAIDLTGIPLPKATIAVNDSASTSSKGTNSTPSANIDVATVFSTSLLERFGGDHLEELLLSECKPTTEDVKKICDAATSVGLRRLGLANNGLTREGLEHIVRYLESGKCEGLDLGGNPIGDDLDLLTNAIESHIPLYALSLADCDLKPFAMHPLLQAFTQLPDFRFIDVSHNPALFSSQPDALSTFRRFLPKLPHLKRIHLADVNLSADHTIALAEILPECPSLSHLNILENPAITALASATDPEAQEEACAVYASLLAAVRVSRTIIAVDIEDPSAKNNEVVKALASQIVAYCLHNLEGGALEAELSGGIDPSLPRTAVPIPDILQHIVGHGNADEGAEEDDEPAPDEDYVIGGTGVVKALGVCLGNLDRHIPGDVSGPPSGTATPRHRKSRSLAAKRPRDMSKNLLESARGIRSRIETALVREDRAGNDANYRRLQFLDSTLQKMIQRFEDEYPETRIVPQPVKQHQETSSQNSGEDSYLATSFGNVQLADAPADHENAVDDDEGDQYAVRLSRSSSITSLYSRAMTSEEGHVHRLGQNIRRDFVNPQDEAEEGELSETMDESQITALREKLDRLHEEQTRSHFESVGADKAFQELGSTVEELWAIQRQDSEAYEKFKQSQIAAQINSGRRTPSVSDLNRTRARDPSRERPSAS